MVRISNAIGDNLTAPAIGTKASQCQFALSVGRKEDSPRVSQNTILDRPIKRLLNMLQRVLIVEPWVKCAMDEHSIAQTRVARRRSRGDPNKGPYSIDNNRIICCGILAKPLPQTRRKCISAQMRLA